MHVLSRPLVRLGAAVTTILLGVGLFASIAPAANGAYEERGGLLYDPSGDGPVPQRDIVWVKANSDPNEGRFWGYVELQARPTAATAAEFRVFYGTWQQNGSCLSSVMISGRTARPAAAKLAGARAVSHAAEPLRSGRAPAHAAANANQVSFTAASAQAKGQQFTCFFAELVPIGAPRPATTTYDTTDADALLRNGPASLFSTSSTVRAVAKKWRAVPITVHNLGASTARTVRVRITRVPKGMAVRKRVVAVAKIRPDGKRVARFQVRKMGPGTGRLPVRVTAAGADPETDFLSVQVAPKPPKSTRNLAGRFFWTTRITFGQGWDNDGLHFVNKRFAYRGLPPKGIPHCRRRTATATGDGCVPYWFNAKRNILQVDAARGRAVKGGFKLGGDTYAMRLRLPKPGSRLRVNLVHVDSLFCPGPLCTTWFTSFETWKNGTYRLNSTRGRYRILPRGRIRLTAGGKSQIRTLTYMTTAKGKPAPAKKGVFLGGTNYYRG